MGRHRGTARARRRLRSSASRALPDLIRRVIAVAASAVLVVVAVIAGVALPIVTAGPAAALANLDCTAVYGQDASGKLYTVSSAGVATAVTMASSGDTTTNALGISSDGSKAYEVSRPATGYGMNNVWVWDAATNAWSKPSATIPAALANIAVTGGAVDPVSGKYYFGGSSSAADGKYYLFSYSPATNSIAQAGTISHNLTGGINGDIAFDASGNLYLQLSQSTLLGTTYPASLYSATSAAVQAASGTNAIPATLIRTTSNYTAVFNGVAFDANGNLLADTSAPVGGSSAIYKISPTGDATSINSASGASLVDMASCTRPGTLTLQKNVAGRVASSDQFTLTIAQGTGASATTVTTATTTGSSTGVQPIMAGPVVVSDKTAYTVSETMASGSTSAMSVYTSSYTCTSTDFTTKAVTTIASGSGTSATVTAASGTGITCTFSNSPPPAPKPYDCTVPTVFMGQSTPTQLQKQVQSAGSTTFVSVGRPSGWQYNALGYNTKDGFLYAVSQQLNATYPRNHLLKIAGDGGVTDLGSITGLVAADTTIDVNAGFFDDSGNFYVAWAKSNNNASGNLYKVNLSTLAATQVALTASTTNGSGQTATALVYPADLAWVGGYAWGVNAGQIYRISLASGATTGQVSTFAIPSGMPSGAYGSAWTYVNGNLGFDNNAGQAYQVQVTNPGGTPTFALVATDKNAPGSSLNDGTSCGSPATVTVTKTADKAVASAGDTVTWTITATNTGPGISSGFVVTDAVPAAYTNVAVTGSTIPGTTSANTYGCTVTGNNINCFEAFGAAGMAVNSSYTLTFTATVGNTTGCPTNTVSLLGNEQPPVNGAPGWQTGTSQTCVPPANVNLAKQGLSVTGPNSSGNYTATYAITVTNSGGVSATYGELDDTLDFTRGLTYQSVSWSGQASGSTTSISATTPIALTTSTTTIGPGVTQTYNVTVVFSVSDPSKASACGGGPGYGIPNVASFKVPSEQNGPTSDDSACLNLNGPPPAYTVSKQASGPNGPLANGALVNPGDTITYTVTATGTSGLATGVVLTDNLSDVLDDATFVSATLNLPGGATGTATLSGTTLTSQPFTLNSGQTATMVYKVTVKAGDSLGHLHNVVTGSSPGGPPTSCSPCSTDQYTPGLLYLQKVQWQPGGATVPVGGSAWTLQADAGGAPGAALTPPAGVTGQTGVFVMKVPSAGSYWLTETTAPAGDSLLAQQVGFTMAADGTVTVRPGLAPGTATVTTYNGSPAIRVLNRPALPLPFAGGRGWAPYERVALILLAGACAWAGLAARRRHRPGHRVG